MEKETFAIKRDNGWEDMHGIIAPFRPGIGPRTNPKSDFPSGPDIGTRLPDIVAASATGPIDVHDYFAGRPGVVVVFRSAVW